jgi:hypothetical protein
MARMPRPITKTTIRRTNTLFRKISFKQGAKCAALLALTLALALAQDRPTFRVKVDMVVLSFQITDNKGKYISGLKPKDIRITEDGILQKLATFGEGNKPTRSQSIHTAAT